MRIGLRGIGTVDRLIASDPGLVQLRVASGKVLSLGMSLAVLYGFTKLAGQPFTVALLSVLIPMIASMAPLQQLAAVRTSIERLINGITCLRSRSRASWVLTVLGICDHAVRDGRRRR